jgi:uncharacterized protein
VEISYDEEKRREVWDSRGLNFDDASRVFDGTEFTIEDDRFFYPEPRYQTMGVLFERLVMVVWTPTENGKRIISMRKCNDREQIKYRSRME